MLNKKKIKILLLCNFYPTFWSDLSVRPFAQKVVYIIIKLRYKSKISIYSKLTTWTQ